MAFRAATYRTGARDLIDLVLQVWRFEQLLTHTYRGMRELLFCRYGVSSSYLPFRQSVGATCCFAGTAFRAATYQSTFDLRLMRCFTGMAFRVVTYLKLVYLR